MTNGSEERIVLQGSANMQYQKGLAAVLGYNKGGKLTLTDKRLLFKAHALNFGQKEYSIPLNTIKATDKTFHILTPSPNMIQVELISGEVYKFVVARKDKEKWKSTIMEYVAKANL